MYKTKSCFSGNVILRNRPLEFPIPVVLDMTGCRKCRMFGGDMFESSQKLHGGDRKHTKVCKKTKIPKSTDELFFHPYANFNCP